MCEKTKPQARKLRQNPQGNCGQKPCTRIV